jgi:hypothetical protein
MRSRFLRQVDEGAGRMFEFLQLRADVSERMLREHYREVVAKQDAEKYWNIRAQNRLQSNSGNAVFVLKTLPDAFE